MKYNRIPGFHMTSPKFKLRFIKQSLLLCFYYSTLKPFFVLRYRTFEFPRLSHDAAFSWLPGKLSCGLKTSPILEDLLSTHSLSQNKYCFNLYEFLKRRIHTLKKLKNRFFCWFPAAIFVPLSRTKKKHSVSATKLNKFGWNIFPHISHMKYCTDLILGKAFCKLSPFISQILDLLY